MVARNLPTSADYAFEVFLDEGSIATGMVSIGPSSSQAAESDLNFDLPMLSTRSHTLRFVVYDADKATVASSENHFEVLEPPRVLLPFPTQGQRFECSESAGVTIFFTFDLTYELSTDFLEAGAGYLGAAAIVDGRRGVCVFLGARYSIYFGSL